MEFTFSAEKAIKARHSTRTYEAKPLTSEDEEKLIAFSKTLTNPFDIPVSFRLLHSNEEWNAKALGTYGVIKGTKAFIGGTVPKGAFALEAFGYAFEKLILYAASLGIGTCWLGGTFRRSGFEKAMGVKEGELFPAISAIGYPAGKKSLTEALFQRAMKSKQRKPWKELFFQHDFETPLTEEAAGKYALPLEMLRLGPSAVNKQPWRVVYAGGAYHFYEEKTLQKKDALDIQSVDLGIAICHFHLTALENNLPGKFSVLPPKDIPLPANTQYSISWITS